MAVSNQTFLSTRAVVAAPGTAVFATVAVPDNCEVVVIYNPSAGTAYVRGTGPAGVSLLAATDAIPIPTLSSYTIPTRRYSERAGPVDFIYDCSVATSLVVNYHNQNKT